MSQVVEDLLARLRARQGAAGEVVAQRPQALEAQGRVAAPSDGRQAQAPRASEEQARRLRLARGRYTAQDLAWAREVTRSPYVTTEAKPYCRECPWRGRGVTYLGVRVAEDCCEHDGVCALAEAEEEARLRAEHGEVPLWARRYRESLLPYLGRHVNDREEVAA